MMSHCVVVVEVVSMDSHGEGQLSEQSWFGARMMMIQILSLVM